MAAGSPQLALLRLLLCGRRVPLAQEEGPGASEDHSLQLALREAW